jgi:hypothetical protein
MAAELPACSARRLRWVGTPSVSTIDDAAASSMSTYEYIIKVIIGGADI